MRLGTKLEMANSRQLKCRLLPRGHKEFFSLGLGPPDHDYSADPMMCIVWPLRLMSESSFFTSLLDHRQIFNAEAWQEIIIAHLNSTKRKHFIGTFLARQLGT